MNNGKKPYNIIIRDEADVASPEVLNKLYNEFKLQTPILVKFSDAETTEIKLITKTQNNENNKGAHFEHHAYHSI